MKIKALFKGSPKNGKLELKVTDTKAFDVEKIYNDVKEKAEKEAVEASRDAIARNALAELLLIPEEIQQTKQAMVNYDGWKNGLYPKAYVINSPFSEGSPGFEFSYWFIISRLKQMIEEADSNAK